MRTELLEALVRQCVREVLDQVEEEVNASKLKSSGIGKGDGKEPAKQKIPVKPFKTGSKKKVNITKLNEAEEDPNAEKKPEDQPAEPSPEKGPEAAAPAAEPSAPATPSVPPSPTPEEPKTAAGEPAPAEKPQRIPKGASIINPKDKSKLDPIKWMGRDESSIERTLHQVAVSMAGPRTKVSLGAKRMAREAIANPNLPIYFYLGKMDPESEEVFLMADKSLQIAKDDSVQPGDLTGTPVSTPPPAHLNYGAMNDDEYTTYMNQRNLPKPRYGIDESAAKLIKRMVNQILDS